MWDFCDEGASRTTVGMSVTSDVNARNMGRALDGGLTPTYAKVHGIQATQRQRLSGEGATHIVAKTVLIKTALESEDLYLVRQASKEMPMTFSPMVYPPMEASTQTRKRVPKDTVKPLGIKHHDCLQQRCPPLELGLALGGRSRASLHVDQSRAHAECYKIATKWHAGPTSSRLY